MRGCAKVLDKEHKSLRGPIEMVAKWPRLCGVVVG